MPEAGRGDGSRTGPGRTRRGALLHTALAALAAMALLGGGCGGEPGEDLPEEVIGTWSTSHEPYSGREFRIARDSIFFETMDGLYEGYPIEDVDISTEEGRLLFTVVYRSSADREYDFSFFYDAPGEGKIRFKNRRSVPWDKAAGPDSSASGQGD